MLRYLVFLLGDPSYDALFAQLAGVDGDRFSPDIDARVRRLPTSHSSNRWSEQPVATRTRSPGSRAWSKSSATLPNGRRAGARRVRRTVGRRVAGPPGATRR